MRILLLLALSASMSCSSLLKTSIEKPKVELQNVGVQSVSATGAKLLFALKVKNPNPFPLKVDGLKYNVEVNDKPITEGELNSPAEVGANGESVIDIPVALKYSEVFSSLADLLQKGASPYRFTGTARLGFFDIPFSHSGEIKLRK